MRHAWVLGAALVLAACGSTPDPVPRATRSPVRTPAPAATATPDVVGERDWRITTVLGSGTPGFSGDGGAPTRAQLDGPVGLAINRGDVLVADRLNHRLRRLTYDGALDTYLGTGVPGFNGDGPSLRTLQVNLPERVTSDDATGLVFIADTGNHMLRCVDPQGTLITVAGGGKIVPTAGGGALAGLDASLGEPAGMGIDSAGHLYMADRTLHRILRIRTDHTWSLEVVAGTGSAGYGGDGGPALQARFDSPSDVVVDAQDNVYVADTGNHRVRKISPDGRVTTFAGSGTAGFAGDEGPAETARIDGPRGLAVDNQGSLFIADTLNHRVRVVRQDGTMATLAGTGEDASTGDGGLPTAAALRSPVALAYSPTGGLYVVDRDAHCVRQFNIQ